MGGRRHSGPEGQGLFGGLPSRRTYRMPWAALEHPAYLDLVPGDDGAVPDATRAWLTRRPLEVEIGFGRGHFLTALAAAHPETAYVGFEMRRKWCDRLLAATAALPADNLRVAHGDARALLAAFPAGSLRAVYVQFPDPWPKGRHERRRVVQPASARLLADLLEPGGTCVLKTDVAVYLSAMDAALTADPRIRVADPAPAARLPRTHREKKCIEYKTPFFLRRYVRTGDGLESHAEGE